MSRPKSSSPEYQPTYTNLAGGESAILPFKHSIVPRFVCGIGARQAYRIIFLGEKSSLAPVLRPIAERIGAELILPTGEISSTLVHGIVKRAIADGRPAVILYFADFDPSGHQMSISVARKLQAFRDFQYHNLDVQLHRVALTLDQVREFDLPSTPLKESERRADRWKAVMHHEQTEIDALCALQPETLEQIAEEAIQPFYDGTLEERTVEAEEEWEEKATELLQSHPAYSLQVASIEAMHQELISTTRKLNAAQAEARQILLEVEPPAIEAPAAELDQEEVPEPLFTTNDDFVTASLKLKADKELAGNNGDE